MDPDFVHLHVHSFYSMMHGVNSPEALCREAKKAGFSHLALTDSNGFYGLVNFLEAACAAGIKPIVGVRVKTEKTSAVLLARTSEGMKSSPSSLPGAIPSMTFRFRKAFRKRAVIWWS